VYTPTLAITGNTVICEGGSTTLFGSSSASNFTWNPGNQQVPSLNVSPPVSTVYTLSAISVSNSLVCPVEQTVNVTVNPTPTIQAASSQSMICKNEVATFTASGASTYTWTGPTGNIGTSSSATVTSANPATLVYTVSGESAAGCKSTAVVVLNISACTGISEIDRDAAQVLIYPNPNNGEFTIKGKTPVELRILNELGQLVKTVKLSNPDKEVKVDRLSPGIYFIVSETSSQKIIVNK
jgi:hypothetical protein